MATFDNRNCDQDVVNELELIKQFVSLTPNNTVYTSTQIPASALNPDEEFFGSTWVDTKYIGNFIFLIAGLQDFATVELQWSDDGTTFNGNVTPLTNEPTESGPLTYNVYLNISNVFISGRYVRVHIINGSTLQTGQIGIFTAGKDPYIPLIGIEAQLSLISRAILGRFVAAGKTPDNAFENARIQGPHAGNTTSTPLNGDAVWRGEWFEWRDGFVRMEFALKADVEGTVYIDLSQEDTVTNGDDSSITDSTPIVYDPDTAPLLRRTIVLQSRWVRLRYVNGPTAQAAFSIGTTFTTTDSGLGMQPYSVIPGKNQMAGMVRNIQAIQNEAGTGYLELQGRDDGSSTQTIVAHEAETPIKPLNSVRVGQGTIIAFGAAAFPGAGLALPNRKTIEYSNHSAAVNVYWGPTQDVTALNGKILRAGSDVAIEVDDSVDIWMIAQDVGGTSAVSNNAGGSAGGTATSPSNALASDDAYASLVNGQTLTVSGFTYAKVLDELSTLRIGVEGNKDSTPATQTVTVQETVVGATTGATSISTTSQAGGTEQLIVVFISRNATNNISSVSGGGKAFSSLIINQATGGRHLDVWYAVGDFTAGAITASMSSSTNAHITAIRVSGAHQSSTFEDYAATFGTGTSVTGPSLNKTALGLGLTGVSHEAASATPGAGYTERSDATNGTGSNTDSLATETKEFVSTGTEAATMTLSSSTEWVAASVRVRPAPTKSIVYSVDFDVNGGGYTNAGSLTFSSTVDATQYLDITGLHPLTEADINLTTIKLTRTSAGIAAGRIDYIFLEVGEATTDSTARISYAEIADNDYP